MSILNDAEFELVNINTTRFTSATGSKSTFYSSFDCAHRGSFSESIQVHDGFQKTFEWTADGLLAGVKRALSTTGSKQVLVTGHSLGMYSLSLLRYFRLFTVSFCPGAAIAELDAMMLKQELGSDVQVQTTIFAPPRVGNQAWASFVDSGVCLLFLKSPRCINFIPSSSTTLSNLSRTSMTPSPSFHPYSSISFTHKVKSTSKLSMMPDRQLRSSLVPGKITKTA
jgi:hypothetical protein